MIAVVVVRDGVLPLGGAEAAAEAGGEALVVGTGTAEAAGALAGCTVHTLELPAVIPGLVAQAVAPHVGDRSVICPASPDGRDLAPRLAALLDRPLLAGAVSVTAQLAVVARRGGLVLEDHAISGAIVATLQPGVRGVEPTTGPAREIIAIPHAGNHTVEPDAEVIEVLAPDVATMDLSEAPRIVGGGAGLDGSDRLTALAQVAGALGASLGVTRVVTDRGWTGHERQIGTTGVVVSPTLYVNFAVSGAVQHTSGLGDPEHIISVNTDPHCPMMAMADLAIVSDANQVIAELASLLSVEGTDG